MASHGLGSSGGLLRSFWNFHKSLILSVSLAKMGK